MSRLDEIEKLARRVESFAESGYMPPAQAFDLARALLAMLPVVRAAGAWRIADEAYCNGLSHTVDGGIQRSETAVADAIDAMQKALR